MPIYECITARLDLEDQVVRELAMALSPDERRRAARYRHPRDRRRFVVMRARLRDLLGARLDSRAESIAFACGAHGKPALAGPARVPALRFSLARSGELALYAFSRGREIGVDLEALPAPHDCARIAARFFSPREEQAWRSLDPAERPAGFLRCWTRREAFVKAQGASLGRAPERFEVPEGGRWRFENFAPAPGFIAAVAIEA